MASFMHCCDGTSDVIMRSIDSILSFLQNYRWIIEAYVSDYYTHDHWSKLPSCIREYIDDTVPPDWAWMLEKGDIKMNQSQNHRPIPLTLMAMKICISNLSLNRTAVDLDTTQVNTEIGQSLKDSAKDRPCPSISSQFDKTKRKGTHSTNVPAFQPSNYKNGQCMDMQHLFRRHVKPKKQHEIQKLGHVINLLSEITACKQVVDIGSGLGHLSRILTFYHGLKVITVEADGGHAPKASDFDRELKKDVLKKRLRYKKDCSEHCSNSQSAAVFKEADNDENIREMKFHSHFPPVSSETSLPSHIVCRVDHDIASSQLLKILKEYGIQGGHDSDVNNFILTGLHACGDLSPSLLRIFLQCSSATALASVGCCYMKMEHRTQDKSDPSRTVLENYPMSHHLKQLPRNDLNYECREMACHFADAYCQRLKDSPSSLKVHAYRAGLQHLLSQICPTFQSGQIRLVTKKGTEDSFRSYASATLQKLNINASGISQETLQKYEDMTRNWKRVVAFYTMRLSLAPLVESLLLLDRILFLKENGVCTALVPIFDSSLSPRNFVILAVKS